MDGVKESGLRAKDRLWEFLTEFLFVRRFEFEYLLEFLFVLAMANDTAAVSFSLFSILAMTVFTARQVLGRVQSLQR